jgi:hypothetical protein
MGTNEIGTNVQMNIINFIFKIYYNVIIIKLLNYLLLRFNIFFMKLRI